MDEKSRLRSCERGDRTNGSSTKRTTSLPDLSPQDNRAAPVFTIAIPTYNRLETLKAAIDSALNQDINFRSCENGANIEAKITKKSYEIIVVENVDDFSAKSNAQKMLESEYFGKVTYYKNEANLGLFGNWNRCIELAQGKWVCLLHSDDLLMPNYLREMQNALAKLDENKVGMIS
ncbi:glycosyltransferase family 2 protein, partial [Helicobacter sp. 23-1045]